MSNQAIDQKNVEQPNELSKKIQEERNLSKKSLVEIKKKWKAILSQEKLGSLKDEFHEIHKRYKDEIQRKNDMVKHLVIRFEKGEDMRRTAISSHLQVIDGMKNVK